MSKLYRWNGCEKIVRWRPQTTRVLRSSVRNKVRTWKLVLNLKSCVWKTTTWILHIHKCLNKSSLPKVVKFAWTTNVRIPTLIICQNEKYITSILLEVDWIFTVRKRSLGQGNVSTPVCPPFCSRGGVCILGVCIRGVFIRGGVCIWGLGGGGRHLGGGWADPPPDTMGYSQWGGGTHPTGMHSCFNLHLCQPLSFSTVTFYIVIKIFTVRNSIPLTICSSFMVSLIFDSDCGSPLFRRTLISLF